LAALLCCLRRLGVPFIGTRGLGAVGSNPGRQILPSVGWRTGQSGAPPDTDRFRFLSQFSAVDRCSFGAVGAPDTVRCTPDSPVPPSSRWLGHVSRADRAVDRWPGRPLAHRTVRCTPDSPVNYSRTSPVYMYMWAGLARHGTGPQKHGPQRHGPQKHISNYGPCRASTCAQSSAHGTAHN
jgi:hypothetical protein